MAKSVLTIVETAYRATLEEQDDTVLWFNHAMKNAGTEVSVLLRANAVNYAVEGQDASGLRIGDLDVAHPPDFARDLENLIAAGVPVYYVTEDVEERGIPTDRLLGGAKGVSRSEIPGLFGAHDLVWHW